MQTEQIVMRSDDARRHALVAAGWVVTSRSWAAELATARVSIDVLSVLTERGRRAGSVREMVDADLGSVLALDSATLADYPGGVATQHVALTPSTARVTGTRRAFGIIDDDGRALAVTYLDVAGGRAETDFTVVAADHRGRGLGTAVKAASVLTLARDGVEVFRTGGSAENAAILRANLRLGYVVDEEWLTLSAPDDSRVPGVREAL